MDAEAGRFIMPDEMELRKDLSDLERTRIELMPTLAIGELVSIKGVTFVVRSIKQNGRLGLKMLKKPGGVAQ